MKEKFKEDEVLMNEVLCECGEPFIIEIFERYCENNQPTPYGFTIQACSEGECDALFNAHNLDSAYLKIQEIIKIEYRHENRN